MTTMRKGLRLQSLMVLSLVVMGALASGARAAEVARGVGMELDAWYYNDPASGAFDAIPEGLPEAVQPVRDAANPYPGETLHVGVNAGTPEAHVFVALPVSTLDPGGT